MLNILSLSLQPNQIIMLAVWLLIIILAVVLEEQTAELVSIWFAAGGVFGLVGALCNWPIYIQFIVFAVITLVLVISTRPLAKKISRNTEVKTNADKLIGMKGKLLKAITEEEKGEVKINYQIWSCSSVDNKPIPENSKIVVKEIVGNHLIVDTIEEIEIK